MAKKKKIIVENAQMEVFETNSLIWKEVLGSKLVGAFVQESLVRLYFKKDDGDIIRIKILFDYYPGMFEVTKLYENTRDD